MIKAIIAHTAEIDDGKTAVEEILAQVESGGSLSANSIGLVSCYPDFLESGVVAMLSAAFPFEIVGTTTISAAAPGSEGSEILTLMILTGDDVRFVTGLTDRIDGETEAPILEGYARAAGARPGERPALILSYAPLSMNAGGDFFVNTMSKASGGIPNFGTIAVDNNIDYSQSRVLHHGEAYADRYAFVLVYGKIRPRFYLATLSTERIFRDSGIVTRSEGNQLYSINDLSAEDYLISLGLGRDENNQIVGVNSYPFIVDYNDGTEPVVRVIFAITPEGGAVCGGDIPVGTTLSVGSMDADGIVGSTREKFEQIVADGKHSALLVFSCIGRYFYLGYETSRETDAIREILDPTGIPYVLTYSGGEICPTRGAEETMANRFHNTTVVACAL